MEKTHAPVEVGSLSHDLQGFFSHHPNAGKFGISEPSTLPFTQNNHQNLNLLILLMDSG